MSSSEHRMGSILRPVCSRAMLIGSGSKGSTTARLIVFLILKRGKTLWLRTIFSGAIQQDLHQFDSNQASNKVLSSAWINMA